MTTDRSTSSDAEAAGESGACSRIRTQGATNEERFPRAGAQSCLSTVDVEARGRQGSLLLVGGSRRQSHSRWALPPEPSGDRVRASRRCAQRPTGRRLSGAGLPEI
jgi:hypothetical protein